MRTGVWLETWGVTRHATADGRCLEVSAGTLRGTRAFRFDPRDTVDWAMDVVSCDFRIADRDGRLWSATSRFTTRLFVTHMFDLAGGGEMDLFRLPEEGRRFKETGRNNRLQRYRAAFRDHLLLADARFFSDDRIYRHLLIDGRVVRIKFKYLCLSVDLAGCGEDDCVDTLAVRVARHSFWDEDYENGTPPLAFDMAVTHFLRHNTAVRDEETERWRDSPLPMPLVFAPADGVAEPQANVRVLG